MDIIDIAGFARFSEKEIWKAIEKTEIKYQDWVARKEVIDDEPVLHIYIELKPDIRISKTEAKNSLDEQLSDLVSDLQDIKAILNYDPLKVSFIRPGAFATYMNAQQQAGADLAHIKPPHMQPSDEIMMSLQSE